MPFNRIVNFFTSLRLTVACLAFAMILVFVGTLAQVHEGLYQAQASYFKSFFVYWGPKEAGWRIPVMPGGYFLGTVLLVNLLAAHAKRFKLTRKKIGIFMIHAGVILLLLGQLLTDVLSVETNMRLTENHSKNYTESSLNCELAISDVTDPDYDEVVAIPESLLKPQAEIQPGKLPFILRVKHYFANSEPAASPAGGGQSDVQGIGGQLQFAERPQTVKMDDKNIPAATIEVNAGQKSLGTWLVSDWVAEEPLLRWVRKKFKVPAGGFLDAPQQFTHDGRTYQIALRPVRYYRPYEIELLKFTHEKYKGTDIPKNFASRIRLMNPQAKEDREVLIYMNSPLRYRGETFYQGSFDQVDERVSILQVVRNPGWLTPYFSCGLVALGLLTQFLSHLVPFVKRRIA